ncbi:single-stranded DNA-binding protein [Dactylosporangium sp. NPDC049525]|uniref:single-stranded DNA-binding protein n=1 Tax=Dactylosporangium sp. NPDC049525 TaxID=3154730 RepID=UPI003436C30A
MNETTMTIVGNVLTEPECRRLEESRQLVTNFRVAATSRRYDRHQERWVDGDTLRLRVTCWRQLAENVMRCVHVGDPVVVTGRLSSRNWETEEHVKRVAYELEATSVGHDLSRGRAKFARVRPNTLTSAIDDELSEARIAGQPSTPVAALNDLPRHRDYDAELGGFVTTVEEPPQDATRDPFAEDVLTELDNAVSAAFDGSAFAAMAGFTAPDDAGELTTADAASDGEATSGDESEGSDDENASGESDEASGGRRRRNRGGRVPVPA